MAKHKTVFTDKILASLGSIPPDLTDKLGVDLAQGIIKLGQAYDNEEPILPGPICRLLQILEHTRCYQTAVVEADYPLGFAVGTESDPQQRQLLREHRNAALAIESCNAGIVGLRQLLTERANTSFILGDDAMLSVDDVEWKRSIWTPLYKWVERGYHLLFSDMDREDWPTCIPEDALIKWQDKRQELEWRIWSHAHKLMPNDAAEAPPNAGKKRLAKKGESVPKRSWTQKDLDAEIWKYKANRASPYNEMRDAIKVGKRGAMKAAREIFGRNAIARALGVKAKAMVSKSPAWSDIAEGLRLDRKPNLAKRKKRIGLDIALEEQSDAAGDTTIGKVTQNETVAFIRKTLTTPQIRQIADDLAAKVEAGTIGYDEVRAIIETYQQQQEDDNASRMY
jgi:hypothetical protein